jgi:hypothetical protein
MIRCIIACISHPFIISHQIEYNIILKIIELKDGRKGKRNGRPMKAKKLWVDDPYEYHGFYKSEINM